MSKLLKMSAPTSFVDPLLNVTRNAKDEIQAFFDFAKNDYETRWPELANKLKEALDTGLYDVEINITASASSPASVPYNKVLSMRRFDAIVQMFQTWQVAGQNAFQDHLNSGALILGEIALGEQETVSANGFEVDCTKDLTPSFRIIYSPESSLCRRASIATIKQQPKYQNQIYQIEK